MKKGAGKGERVDIAMEGGGGVDTAGGRVGGLFGRLGELLSGSVAVGKVLSRVADSSIPPATDIPNAWA